MRLYKCHGVENYLIDRNLMDERHIWCYAQMKAKLSMGETTETLYGLVLVCVKKDGFYVYITEFNSTKLELFYTCKIHEMNNIYLKKKWLFTRLTFTKNTDCIQLDMDGWKRFFSIFQLSK